MAQHRRCYAWGMQALKAQVRNGRITVEEPVDLPDGEVYLTLLDADDDLDDEERAARERAIDRGLADAQAGRVVDASEVFAWLRARP